MRGSGRSIAAVAFSAVLGGLCGAGLWSAWTTATADIVSLDSDEAIRTAPETTPDFAAVPIAETEAEVAAIRAPGPPVAVEYAQASAVAVNSIAAPAFRQAETVIRDYEPRVQFASDRGATGAMRNEISFGLNRPERARRAPAVRRNDTLASFRNLLEPAREVDRRGRWILFASDEQQAVGVNLLRSRAGEMRRMSWTADRVANVGDAQVGVGWRRGAFQAALSLVDREISIYGKSRDERFVAFTISIKPRGGVTNRQRDRMQPAPYAPRSNPR